MERAEYRLYRNSKQSKARISRLKEALHQPRFRTCHTVRQFLLEGERIELWEGYHIPEIASTIGVTNGAVSKAIHLCEEENGVAIHCLTRSPEGMFSYSLKARIAALNEEGHWHGMTRGEIAYELGVRPEAVTSAICKLKQLYGIEVDYVRREDELATRKKAPK